MRARAKKLLPWVVSLVMCGVLLWPFHDPAGRAVLFDALSRASPWTIPVVACFAIINWLTDSWATGMTFRYFGIPIPLRDAIFLRGSTLVFEAVNPSLGQVALGVFLYRRGTPLARTVQLLLVINVVFMASMVSVAGVGLAMGAQGSSAITTGVATTALVFLGAYVALIAIKPAFLAKRKGFVGLFEAGLRGHAAAFALRIPSISFIVGVEFATLFCFGIKLPVSAVLVYFPAIMFLTGMPVSVQGIGPAQLAQVAFFASFVKGVSPREAEATVLAWGLTSSVLQAFSALLIGIACGFTDVGRAAFLAGKSGTLIEDEVKLASATDG